jgi:hypothetical protein
MRIQFLPIPTLIVAASLLALGTGAKLPAPPDAAAVSAVADLADFAGVPRPRAGITPLVFLAPDSSVQVGSRLFGLKGTIPGDSLIYQYTVNDTLKASARRGITVLVDSGHPLPAPAYGATAVYKGSVTVLRGTTRYVVASWSWTYQRPPAPIPSADSAQRVALFVVDGNLAYTRTGFFNVATTTQDADCGVGQETLDALGRMVTRCRMANGGAAYTTVNCVVVERASGARWAYPSNTVSDCLTKAGPLAAAKYGTAWHPEAVPFDSIAFQMLPAKVDTARGQYQFRAVATLK